MLALGHSFEERAAQWVQAQGWQILQRNYRCKLGEIDIIAEDNQQLVFIEVRARSNRRFASAAGSVDRRKQQKLVRAAALYLRNAGSRQNFPCRFDVIAFDPRQSGQDAELRWIRSAFTA
ncbi:MAG: YraN family protein [Haliea sp.]|tara:strand:- start:47537 stop:47896 length:360 start_codon:yes stop_codon:yes gene_type:complete